MKSFAPMQAGGSAVSMLMVAIFVLGCGALSAGINAWTSSGPEGGLIRALMIDPQNAATVYAATSGGGVFKSTDGGKRWSAVNSGLTALDVPALAIREEISK